MNIKSFCEKLEQNNISLNEIKEKLLTSDIEFIWHPLGFIMGTLITEEKMKLRIHIWSKKYSKPQKPYWNIHTHIFHLKSWIISGSILNTLYEIEEVNESRNCIYEVHYKDNKSILKKSNKLINLINTNTLLHKKNDNYSIESGVFHSSTLESTSALTIVLSTATDVKTPLVIGKKDYDNFNSKYNREKVNRNILFNILSELE